MAAAADDDYISRTAAYRLMSGMAAALADAHESEVARLKAASQQQLQQQEAQHAQQYAQLQRALEAERRLRLRQTDRAVEAQGGFRVHVVARPCDDVEDDAADRHDFSDHGVTIRDSRSTYCFNNLEYVHPPTPSAPAVIWRECEPFVDGVAMQPPRHVLLLAHGRTGSGKTHLMAQNLVPHTLARLFHLKQLYEQQGDVVAIEARQVDIYHGRVYDADGCELAYHQQPSPRANGTATPANASPANASPAISFEPFRVTGRHAAGTGPHNPRTPLHDLAHATATLADMAAQRDSRSRSTSGNAQSSRSHLVVALFMRTTRAATGETTEGSVHLVDLAGNEINNLDSAAERERVHNDNGLRALGNILHIVHAVSASLSLPSRSNRHLVTTVDHISPVMWRASNLVRAIHRPLSEPLPRVLIFLTLHSAGSTKENLRTLRDVYHWLGRDLPAPQPLLRRSKGRPGNVQAASSLAASSSNVQAALLQDVQATPRGDKSSPSNVQATPRPKVHAATASSSSYNRQTASSISNSTWRVSAPSNTPRPNTPLKTPSNTPARLNTPSNIPLRLNTTSNTPLNTSLNTPSNTSLKNMRASPSSRRTSWSGTD